MDNKKSVKVILATVIITAILWFGGKHLYEDHRNYHSVQDWAVALAKEIQKNLKAQQEKPAATPTPIATPSPEKKK